jgi:hypothetical protein
MLEDHEYDEPDRDDAECEDEEALQEPYQGDPRL